MMWCCGPVAVILVQIRYRISNELMDWMGERCPGILPFRSESRLSVSLLAPTRVFPSGLLSENRKHTCHNDFALVFFVKCFQIFFYFFFSLFHFISICRTNRLAVDAVKVNLLQPLCWCCFAGPKFSQLVAKGKYSSLVLAHFARLYFRARFTLRLQLQAKVPLVEYLSQNILFGFQRSVFDFLIFLCFPGWLAGPATAAR